MIKTSKPWISSADRQAPQIQHSCRYRIQMKVVKKKNHLCSVMDELSKQQTAIPVCQILIPCNAGISWHTALFTVYTDTLAVGCRRHQSTKKKATDCICDYAWLQIIFTANLICGECSIERAGATSTCLDPPYKTSSEFQTNQVFFFISVFLMWHTHTCQTQTIEWGAEQRASLSLSAK